MTRPLLLVALLALAAPARAEEEPAPAPPKGLFPLESAHLRPAGSWSVGVFAPLKYALSDSLELELHPVWSLVAPSALVRVAHLKASACTLTGEYGLSVPLGFGLLVGGAPVGGWLFPSGASAKIGTFVVPRVGLAMSGPVGAGAQLTARADLAVGLPVAGETTVRSLDSFLAPLDLLFAPVLRGFRGHLGGGYDRELLPWLRVRATVDAYVVGRQPDGYAQSSQFIFSSHLGFDIKVGEQSRLTLGAIWWNWDQFKTDVRTGANGFAERVRVRSNDFLPTLDFIWAG